MTTPVSIIVPIYNVEHYLSKCIDSLLAQSFRDFQLILVNDGSSDSSGSICDDYKLKDHRVNVIHQQNTGVSAARNAGLQIASGTYISFVDGDDTIENDFLEKLMEIAKKNNSDSVYSNFSASQQFWDLGKNLNQLEIREKLLPIFFTKDFFNSVCTKIFRNKTIKENRIQFPVGVKHGEDAQFNIEFLMNADKISFANYNGYHYREVEGSATRNIAQHDYLKRIIEVYHTDWKPIIGEIISDAELNRLKKIRLINSVISLVFIYGNRGNSFTDKQRFSKLKSIVKNETVQKVFADNEIFQQLNLGKHSAAIFKNIRKQNVFLLYLLTQYSYYRNR